MFVWLTAADQSVVGLATARELAAQQEAIVADQRSHFPLVSTPGLQVGKIMQYPLWLVVASCAVGFRGTGLAQDAEPVAQTQMVTVAEGVQLEVLDWGGTGRPVVMLAGLGATAHVFDGFAPKLTTHYHVVGITRRGFGTSTVAPSGYTADELGDDVLAVLDFLQLDRPVLVGHSLAGQELSSVANRHPTRVAGLVYLDAAYAYAFYGVALGDMLLDALTVHDLLEQLLPGKGPQDPRPLIISLLEALPQLEKGLRGAQERMGTGPMPGASKPPSGTPAMPAHVQAIFTGQRKFTTIPVPALVIFAVPHDLKHAFPNDPEAQAEAEAHDVIAVEAQARAIEAGVPSARVVRIAHAGHMIFRSHEQDVLREMRAFIDALP